MLDFASRMLADLELGEVFAILHVARHGPVTPRCVRMRRRTRTGLASLPFYGGWGRILIVTKESHG